MNFLIELAERCEKASADANEQRALLREAFEAIHGPKPERVHGGSAEMTAYLYKFNPFYSLITHYGFLDAAMTLVPEDAGKDVAGERFRLESWASNGVHALHVRASAWVAGAKRVYAATPALALCAASLRARASLNRGDQ